jgi:hypothetical protein
MKKEFLDKKENLIFQVKYCSFDEFVEIEESSSLIQRLFIDLCIESELSSIRNW